MSNLQNRLNKLQQILSKDDISHIIICNTCEGSKSLFIDGEEIPVKGNFDDSMNELIKSRKINTDSSKVILVKISDYSDKV